MMTMEQYLHVAQLWYAEQKAGFNPFEGAHDDFYYGTMTEDINDDGELEDGKEAEDGWFDYNDFI